MHLKIVNGYGRHAPYSKPCLYGRYAPKYDIIFDLTLELIKRINLETKTHPDFDIMTNFMNYKYSKYSKKNFKRHFLVIAMLCKMIFLSHHE